LLTAPTYGSLTKKARHENYYQKVLVRHEKFRFKQISIKFESFHFIKINLVQTTNWAEDKHTKISVKIRISADVYRPIFKG